MSLTADELVRLLDARGCRPGKNGTGWHARCPAHEDSTPSLTVGQWDEQTDGEALREKARQNPSWAFYVASCHLEDLPQAIRTRNSLAGMLSEIPDGPPKRRLSAVFENQDGCDSAGRSSVRLASGQPTNPARRKSKQN